MNKQEEKQKYEKIAVTTCKWNHINVIRMTCRTDC